MKTAKAPTSDSYHASLVESLKNPDEAAAFIEAILEEENPEPELFSKALAAVIEVLDSTLPSDQQHQLRSKSEQLLTLSGTDAVYCLETCLNLLV